MVAAQDDESTQDAKAPLGCMTFNRGGIPPHSRPSSGSAIKHLWPILSRIRCHTKFLYAFLA
jgi:hypothetical protein